MPDRRPLRKFRHACMNRILWFLDGALKILPRWFINVIVKGLFALASLATGRIRRMCANNLRLVLGAAKPDQDYERMAADYLKSIGHSMVDMLYYVERPDDLEAITHIHGEEHLQAALSQGRGVLAVSAHLGNFPLMFVALRRKGYPVNVVIRVMRDPVFSRFIEYQCAKWKINMIKTAPKRDFLRECLGALKRNELLVILLDEIVPKDSGIKVRFLGRDVTRAAGPMLFLERTGSPIVPMFIAKDEAKHFQIFIEPSYPVSTEGPSEENLHRNIAGLSRVIEQYVGRYPLQWGGWLNKRWTDG